VVIADLDREAGEETRDEYQNLGRLLFIPTDVGDVWSVAKCLDRVAKDCGRLDGLVNNAGIANPRNTPVESLPLEDWQRMLNTNLTGAFLMVKYAVPLLRRTKGAILNIASTRALQSEPETEAYAAAKGGLLALTHALAVSLGPEIRVNCLSPGWIDVTGWKKSGKRMVNKLSAADHAQHPAGRVGKVEDVAALALFLLSEEAGFITGQNYVVDGGMTRKMIYAE
jgi:NAD(P)-dependent dehydrogenase (short-subunit alcohol dehydrogenase family)